MRIPFRMQRPDTATMTKGGKRLFWAWIAYQTVKGTLTTSLIWIPMFYYYWQQ